MLKKFIAYVIEFTLVLLFASMILFIGVLVYANVQATIIEVDELPKPPTDTITLANGYDYHVADYSAINDDTSPVPLVLLHPFDARGSTVFEDTWLENLRDNFRVIVPDMLGFGYAERVAETSTHYSYASQAAAVIEMLDTLDIETIDVLGHGYGGAVAAQLALDYPERVRRLVFVAPDVYPRSSFSDIAWETLSTVPYGMGRGLLFFSHGAGQRNIDEDTRPFLTATDHTQALFFAHNERDNLTLAPRLSDITQPVAVIASEGDTRVPVVFAEQLIVTTDAEESLILTGGTHYTYLDRPQEVNETLMDFLSE